MTIEDKVNNEKLQQKYQLYHEIKLMHWVKLINVNILQVKKYYILIKEK